MKTRRHRVDRNSILLPRSSFRPCLGRGRSGGRAGKSQGAGNTNAGRDACRPAACRSTNAAPARPIRRGSSRIFKAPEAELFDQAGKRIGKHYAGPTWESDDGSKVAGAVKARDDGPDANAIPWLLLSATSAEGNGIFGKTQSVQRLKTVGGKAPVDGCDQAQLGKIARVSYRATYNFYVARP